MEKESAKPLMMMNSQTFSDRLAWQSSYMYSYLFDDFVFTLYALSLLKAIQKGFFIRQGD